MPPTGQATERRGVWRVNAGNYEDDDVLVSMNMPNTGRSLHCSRVDLPRHRHTKPTDRRHCDCGGSRSQLDVIVTTINNPTSACRPT